MGFSWANVWYRDLWSVSSARTSHACVTQENYQLTLLTDSLHPCWHRSPDCLFPWLWLKQEALCSALLCLCIILPTRAEVQPSTSHTTWSCFLAAQKNISKCLFPIQTVIRPFALFFSFWVTLGMGGGAFSYVFLVVLRRQGCQEAWESKWSWI